MKISLIFIILAAAALTGCRDVRKVTTYNELESLHGKDIRILALDSTVYTAQFFTVKDSSIEITGTRKKNYIKEKFSGEIYYNQITYIQTGEEELFGDFIKAAGTVILLAGSIDVLSATGTNVIVHYVTSGEGSCPYVYSFNGNEYILEGETFGTSLGSAMENETAVVLNSAAVSGGLVKLRYSNERPETHFFNTIKMYAVEHRADTRIFADNYNNIRGTRQQLKILKAADAEGRDITGLLKYEDNSYWESDLSSANIFSGFEDVIYTELGTGAEGDSLDLVITGINTGISNIVFNMLADELGEDYIGFIRACETDNELKSILDEVLRKSALKIDIMEGSEWNELGMIYPEANGVDFSKLIRIPSCSKGGKMVLRLRCMTDLWRINSITYDCSIPEELNITELKPVKEMSDKLAMKDGEYLKLLPGNVIDIEYEALKPSAGKKITYVTKAGGYLYEWIIDGSDLVKRTNPGFPRLQEVKALLKNREVFYQELYRMVRK